MRMRAAAGNERVANEILHGMGSTRAPLRAEGLDPQIAVAHTDAAIALQGPLFPLQRRRLDFEGDSLRSDSCRRRIVRPCSTDLKARSVGEFGGYVWRSFVIALIGSSVQRLDVDASARARVFSSDEDDICSGDFLVLLYSSVAARRVEDEF